MGGITMDGALEWMWDALIMATSFQHWPDGDPDAWRELGDAWMELHEAITDAFNEMNSSAGNVALSWGGDAGQAFIERWSNFVSSDESGPAAFAIAAYDYYSACYNGALQLEYSQLMCLIILTITAIEVAIGLAFAEFGGGAFAAGAIAAGRVAIREVLAKLATAMGRQILKQALKKAGKLAAKKMAFAAVKGGLTFGGADLLAQQIQISEGYRKDFDWKSITTSAAGGAAAGLGGYVFSGALRGGGRWLGNALFGKTVQPWLRAEGAGALRGVTRWGLTQAGHLTQAGLVNIPTMAAMDLTQNAVRTGQFGFSKEYLQHFDKKGVLGELWDQFAAGAFAAGVHGVVNTTGHGLIQGGKWVGGRFAGTPTLAHDPLLSNAEGFSGARGEALARASTALSEAHSYRELELAARNEAAGMPRGAERREVMNEAHGYEALARQADARATTALHEANMLGRHADPGQAQNVRADTTGGRTEQARAGGVRAPETARTNEADTATRSHESGGGPSREVTVTPSHESGGPRESVGAQTHESGGRPSREAGGSPPSREAGGPSREGAGPSHEAGGPPSSREEHAPTGRVETPGETHERSDLGEGSTPPPDGTRFEQTGAGGTDHTVTGGNARESSGTGGSHRVPDEVDPRLLDQAAAAAAAAPIPMALDELRAAHRDHVQADAQAWNARQSAEEVRRSSTQREVENLRLRRPGGERPDLGEHGLRDSVMWRELSEASHQDVVRRLDDLLRRPDLPESARPNLERMREAYRDAANERALVDDLSARVVENRAEAGEFHRNGDRENAVKSAERSGEAAGREARRRMDSVRALARADEALRGVPEVRVDERAPESTGDQARGGSHRVPESTDRSSGGSHRVPESTGDQTGGGSHRVPDERVPVDLSPDGGRPGEHSTGEPVAPQHEGQPAETGPHWLQEERALSEHFGTQYRTGAELPNHVRELVDSAKERLLAKYDAHTVEARIQDLDRVARQADRVDDAVRLVREGGGIRELVDRVRDLSRAVNDYGDKYRNWTDFGTGERTDPGWRDLHGVDPLDSVEVAHRAVSIDPVTQQFHPIDRAIAVAKIEDVLGRASGDHAVRVLDLVVPKDPDAVRALVPDELRTPELEKWIESQAKGGYDPRTGIIYIEPGRAITAVASTVVHEGLHLLQPNHDAVTRAVQDAIGRDNRLSPAEKIQAERRALALIRFEGEHQAFTLQQHFLRGLAGFDGRDYNSDLRIPDEYRTFAEESPAQLQENTLRKYIDGKFEFGRLRAEQLFGTRDLLSQHPDLADLRRLVDRADLAINNSVYYGHEGRLVGPITEGVAREHGVDLDRIQRDQDHQRPPELRDTHIVEERGHDLPHYDDLQTGGSIRPVRDELAAQEWAENAYDLIRIERGDVADVAANVADRFTPEEIARVKANVFTDTHPLAEYDRDGNLTGYEQRHFDADPDIAEAWIRLRRGEPHPADIVLLQHELAEAGYFDSRPGATYSEAHAYASELFNWDRVRPEPSRESIDGWGQEHGDPAVLQEGTGGRPGSGVPLRGDPGRPGPGTDLRQGQPAGEGAGRPGERSVPDRDRPDPAAAEPVGQLAGVRQSSGLTPVHDAGLREILDGHLADSRSATAETRLNDEIGAANLAEHRFDREARELRESLRDLTSQPDRDRVTEQLRLAEERATTASKVKWSLRNGQLAYERAVTSLDEAGRHALTGDRAAEQAARDRAASALHDFRDAIGRADGHATRGGYEFGGGDSPASGERPIQSGGRDTSRPFGGGDSPASGERPIQSGGRDTSGPLGGEPRGLIPAAQHGPGADAVRYDRVETFGPEGSGEAVGELRSGGAAEIGGRKDMEDSGYAGRNLFVVADGMGGHANGQDASRITVETLRELDGARLNDPVSGLQDGLRAANQRLHDQHWAAFEAAGGGELTGLPGTTVTALLFRGNEFALGHVGDSRAYLVRDGELRQITRDQANERGELEQALDGDPGFEVAPQMIRGTAHPGDRFMLVSDGLYGELARSKMVLAQRGIETNGESAHETIARVLREHRDPERAAAALRDELAQLASAAGRSAVRDNVTIIVVDVPGAGEAAGAGHRSIGFGAAEHLPGVEPASRAAEVSRTEAPPAARPEVPVEVSRSEASPVEVTGETPRAEETAGERTGETPRAEETAGERTGETPRTGESAGERTGETPRAGETAGERTGQAPPAGENARPRGGPASGELPGGRADRADVADTARRMVYQLQGRPDASPFKLVAPDPQPWGTDRVHVTTWDGRELTVKVFTARLPEGITHEVVRGADGSIEVTLPDRVEVGSHEALDLAIHESLGRALVTGLDLVDRAEGKGQTLNWLRERLRPTGSALDANRLPDQLPTRAGQTRDWFRARWADTRGLLHLPESMPERYHSTLSHADLQEINHLRTALSRYLHAQDALANLRPDAPERAAAEREFAVSDDAVRRWVREHVADAPRDRGGRLRDADLDRQLARHQQLGLVTDRLPPRMADVVREHWLEQAGDAVALRERPALAGGGERSAPGEVPAQPSAEAQGEAQEARGEVREAQGEARQAQGEVREARGEAEAGRAPTRYEPPTDIAREQARDAIEAGFRVVASESERSGPYREIEWIRDRLLSVTAHDGRQRTIDVSNIIDEIAPHVADRGAQVEAAARLGRRLDAEFGLHPDEPAAGGLDVLARLHEQVPAGARALVEARFDAELRDLRVHGDEAARDRLARQLSPEARDLLDRLYRDQTPPERTAQGEVRDVFAALAGPKETHLLASVRLTDGGEVVGITHDGREISVPLPREGLKPALADALATELSGRMIGERGAAPTRDLWTGANRLRVLAQLHEFSSGEQRAEVGARIRDLTAELGLRADHPEARLTRPGFERLLSGYERVLLDHFGAEPARFEMSHLPEERSHALAAVARTLHRLGSEGTGLVHRADLAGPDRVVARTKDGRTFVVDIPERLHTDLSAHAGRDLAEIRAIEDRHALVVMGEQLGAGLERLIADGHQPRHIGDQRLGLRTLSAEQRQALGHVGGMHGYGAVREHLLAQEAAARYAGDTVRVEALRRELDAVEGELRQYAQNHGIADRALRMVPGDVREVLDRAPSVATEAPRPEAPTRPESATLQEISRRNGGLYANEAQFLGEVREIAPLVTGEGRHELARSLRLDADATLVAELHNGRTVRVPLLDKIPHELPADPAERRVEVTKAVARAVAEAKMEQASPHRWLRRGERPDVLRLDPEPGKLEKEPGSTRDAQRIDELRALGRLDGHADASTRSLIREALRDPRLTEGDLGTAPRRDWVQQRVPDEAWRLIAEANADRAGQLTDVVRVFDRGHTHGVTIRPEMEIQAGADHRVPIDTVHGPADLRLERGHATMYRVVPHAEGRLERLHRFLFRTDPGITVEIRPGRGDGSALIWHEAPRRGSEEGAPPGLEAARQEHPGHYVLYVEAERWPEGVPPEYIDREIGRHLADMVAEDRRPSRLASTRSIMATGTAVQAAGVAAFGTAIAERILEFQGAAGALLTSVAATAVAGVATVRFLQHTIRNVDVWLRETRLQFPESRDPLTEFRGSIHDLREAAAGEFRVPELAERAAHPLVSIREAEGQLFRAGEALREDLRKGSVDHALRFESRPDGTVRVYREPFAPRGAEHASGEAVPRREVGGPAPVRAVRGLRPHVDIELRIETEHTPEFERDERNAKYVIYVPPADHLPEGKTLTEVMHDRMNQVMAAERDFVRKFPSLARNVKATIVGFFMSDVPLGVAVGGVGGDATAWKFGAVLAAAGAARRATGVLVGHWQDRRFEAADTISGQHDAEHMRTIPAAEVDAVGRETREWSERLAFKAGMDEDTVAVHHGLASETSLMRRPATDVLHDAAGAWLRPDHDLAGGATVREVAHDGDPSGLVRKFRIEQPEPALAKVPLIGDRLADALGSRRAADVYLVPGEFPGKAAARILLMRPDETVIAISSRATPEEIAASVGLVRDVVAESLQHNNPHDFMQYVYKNGIGSGTGAASRFLVALTTGHLETSYVTLWATPGGAFGGAFADFHANHYRHWNDYTHASMPDLVPDAGEVGKQHTAAGMTLAADWAWERIEAKTFTVGEAARRLYDHPEYGDEVRRRFADLMEARGVTAEEALRPVRQALLDPRATLAHDRGQTARELLGILDVKRVDADTVRLEFRQHRHDFSEATRELTVHLTPMRFHDEGPAVRAHTVDGRLVVGIDVAAEPQRIQHDLWSEVARQLSIRDATAPYVGSRLAYLENRLTTAATAIVGQGAGFFIGGVNAVAGIGYGEVVGGSTAAAVADGALVSHRQDYAIENTKGRAKDFTARMTGEPSPELIRHTAERMAGLYRFDHEVDAFAHWLEQVRTDIGLPAGRSLVENHRAPVQLVGPGREPEPLRRPVPDDASPTGSLALDRGISLLERGVPDGQYEHVADPGAIADRLRRAGHGATALVTTVHEDGTRQWVVANRDGTLRAVEFRDGTALDVVSGADLRTDGRLVRDPLTHLLSEHGLMTDIKAAYPADATHFALDRPDTATLRNVARREGLVIDLGTDPSQVRIVDVRRPDGSHLTADELAGLQDRLADRGIHASVTARGESGTVLRFTPEGSAHLVDSAGHTEPLPDGPDVVTSQSIVGTHYVPDGRPLHLPDLSWHEPYYATGDIRVTDFAGGQVKQLIWSQGHLWVETRDHGWQRFAHDVQVLKSPRMAQTDVATGDGAHLVHFNHRLNNDQLARVWIHEITDTLERLHARESGSEHGVIRSFLNKVFSSHEPHTDQCVQARLNERAYLQRRLSESTDFGEQMMLHNEIVGVDRDIVERGHQPPPPIPEPVAPWTHAWPPSTHEAPPWHAPPPPSWHEVWPSHEPPPAHSPSPWHEQAPMPVHEHSPTPVHEPTPPHEPTPLHEPTPVHEPTPPHEPSPFQILSDSGVSGDGYTASGQWGRFGAAGVMVKHVDEHGVERFLLVRAAEGYSQGNWQLPGGALNSKETPAQGAAREFSEELGAGQEYLNKLSLAGTHVADGTLGWKYTTLAATAPEMFHPRIDGIETAEARWLTRAEIQDLAAHGELHSAFAGNLHKVFALYEGGEAAPVAAPEKVEHPFTPVPIEDGWLAQHATPRPVGAAERAWLGDHAAVDHDPGRALEAYQALDEADRQRFANEAQWISERSSPESIYEQLFYATRETSPGLRDLSVLDGVSILDHVKGTANEHFFEQKLVDWLTTPEGREFHDDFAERIGAREAADRAPADLAWLDELRQPGVYHDLTPAERRAFYDGVWGLRPEASGYAIYDEVAKRIHVMAARDPRFEGMTLFDGLRILDDVDGGSATPFQDRMGEWLATRAGFQHHEAQAAFDHMVSDPAPLPESSREFQPLTLDGAQAWHDRSGGNWTHPDVHDAYFKYSDFYHRSINAHMRNGENPDMAAVAAHMRSGMRPIDRHVLLHRGTDLAAMHIDHPSEMAGWIGHTLEDKGFMSASAGDRAAFDYQPVLLEIEAPAGTKMAWIDPISANRGENEMLVAPGTRYVVLRVTRAVDFSGRVQHVLRVRVVEQDG